MLSFYFEKVKTLSYELEDFQEIQKQKIQNSKFKIQNSKFKIQKKKEERKYFFFPRLEVIHFSTFDNLKLFFNDSDHMFTHTELS